MRVLIIGAGAREHALVWRLSQSPMVTALMAAPGNPGIARMVPTFAIAVEDIAGLVDLARSQKIDFVIVGPEAPLTLGLVDALAAQGIPALGPSRLAAQLEGSKAFTKALCAEFNIPTAAYATFDDAAAAKGYIRAQGAPIVIKADGLAAGKGVVVAENLGQALDAVDQLLTPELGGRIVIEECLIGEEVSFFALCDGRTAIPVGAAQDHKRAFDGDLGPNTGGMGAYSPAPCFDAKAQDQVMAEIIQPTLAAMAKRGYLFSGILFAGLMMTRTGPKLIEYNVRLGDPETQVLMMRLANDPLPAFWAAAKGDLAGHHLTMSDQSALVVVMAAKDYPGTPKTGTRIGLPDPGRGADSVIFHAGTGLDAGGNLIAKGGRVLSICARGPRLADACRIAYDLTGQIDWPDGFYRRDIGHKALKPE